VNWEGTAPHGEARSGGGGLLVRVPAQNGRDTPEKSAVREILERTIGDKLDFGPIMTA